MVVQQTGHYIKNTRGDALNWLRLFEVVGFIIVWIGIFTFMNYTIVKKYSLTDIEMYPVYIVWAVGMILMFVMRYYRKKQ